MPETIIATNPKLNFDIISNTKEFIIIKEIKEVSPTTKPPISLSLVLNLYCDWQFLQAKFLYPPQNDL